MAPPHSDYHILQGVPRKGALTVLSNFSEPAALRSSTSLGINLSPRSSSSASLPSLKTSRQVMHSLNLGVNNRRSAIRSLASNPNLSVNVFVDGRVSVLRRNNPRGSPTGATSLPEPAERIVPLSKDGYHPRSRSPTYETLILAKSQLDLLLSRRLREIRRDFDGQKARQNSAVFSEIMTESRDMEESWYLDAVDGDDDLSAIETTRASNEDDATSLETICTSGPVPHRPIKFSSTVLKDNICNRAILDMKERETQAKLEKWRDDHATNIPKLERLDSSPIVKRRQCLSDPPQLNPEERFLFLRRTSRSVEPAKTKSFKRKPKSGKVTKQVIVEESKPAPEPEPILPKAETIIEEIKPKEPEKPLPVVKDEIIEEPRKSLPYANRPDKEEEEEIKKTVSPKLDEIKDVDPDRMKSLRQPTIDQSLKLLNSIDPVPAAVPKIEVPEEEAIQPLTAKEKFLRMQERMQQRKLQKQKTRDSFADYSFMMHNQKKAAERGGGADSNKLGMTLSKRLENMSTFKSTFSDDSDDDDDQDLQLDLSDSEDDDDIIN